MVRRDLRIIRHRVTTALTRSGLPDLDYALNPYTGCLHGCIYCYSRLYTRDQIVSRNWGEIVVVKENLITVLRKEVKKYRPGVVGVSTITDPYQPVEAIYKLTRGSIELLLRHGFHISIQTKNPLVLRDLELLINYRDRVDVGFTITTLDKNKAGFIEPKAPPPSARINALEKLAGEGIDTWIFYGPIIPGLNSDIDTAREVIEIAYETSSRVLIDSLHIKSFMLDPKHPLYKYVTDKRFNRNQWRKLFREILSICSEKKVLCIEGLAEPVEKITLDKYMDQGK